MFLKTVLNPVPSKAFFYLALLLWMCSNTLFAQPKFPKRTMKATRIDKSITLDGDLSEEVWLNADKQSDFLQTEPYNGNIATEKTVIHILYDDDAIYVGAMLYDSAPDSIRQGLGIRDCEDNDIDADLFVAEFNPYNDDLLLYDFKVSSSNVQIDQKVNFDWWDSNWNAVWYSKTKINEKGWSVEMKIPFAALRIPNKDVQTWGVQMHRYIKRKAEWDSWNYLDESINGATQQVGTLVGIDSIKPPTRLSITPYISGYYDKLSDQSKGDKYMRGGLDLKYGINKSYTLDMMLIPDFGQTASDDKVLNLSTVETMYNEKRSFFTEGTELFSRADLFYSRRIGGTPIYKDDAQGKLGANEKITKNPNDAQLINATKLSGRSSSGLAVGFLSATSLRQNAVATDTLWGTTRTILTQPSTHYGVLVVDQALKNNSYISFINTNVSFFEDPLKMANVVGTDMKLSNKSGSYTFWGKSAYSYLQKQEKKTGGYYDITFGKTSGQFRFALWHQLRTENYDCRDLGYLDETNRINNSLRVQYNYYIPKNFYLNWNNSLIIVNNYHYKPTSYSLLEIYLESYGTLKNHIGVAFYCGATPIPKYDFNEPRVNGWKYQEPTAAYIGGNFNTNKNNQLWLFVNTWYWRASEYNRSTYYIEIKPTYNASDKIKLSFAAIYEKPMNSLGWVDNNNAGDTIHFGRRQSINITSVVEAKYLFTATSNLQLRGRYYWSGVEYKQFYLLKKDGTMDPNTPFIPNQDKNYSSFNIDLIYTWQFAPGSELSVMWKNSISSSNNYVYENYGSNLKNLWSNPQLNTVSFRILYYLDYLYLKKKRCTSLA